MEIGILPSVVRLQPLDDCLRRWLNKADFMQAAVGGRMAPLATSSSQLAESSTVDEDRELCTIQLILRCSMSDGKLMDDVVKATPEMENDFSRQNSQAGWGPPFDVHQGNNFKQTVSFRVELGLDALRMRVEECNNFFVEDLQLLACSPKFNLDP